MYNLSLHYLNNDDFAQILLINTQDCKHKIHMMINNI
jgi:hypothetical protein